ncbi:hypothetical protein MRX96_057562 [Rhipicephalus microplus]
MPIEKPNSRALYANESCPAQVHPKTWLKSLRNQYNASASENTPGRPKRVVERDEKNERSSWHKTAATTQGSSLQVLPWALEPRTVYTGRLIRSGL